MISSLRNPSSVAVRLILTLRSCPPSPSLGAGNSVTFLFSLSVPFDSPNPRTPYPLRRGLAPSANVSKDKLDGNGVTFDGNCPDVTNGEGKGVSFVEGKLSVLPLGVRIGEEVTEPPLIEE